MFAKGKPQTNHNGKYRPENDRPSCSNRYPADLIGKPEESDYSEQYSGQFVPVPGMSFDVCTDAFVCHDTSSF